LNHGHGGQDYWYETCVFWDGGSYVLDRYETQDEAENGHENTVDKIRKGEVEVQDNQVSTLTLTNN